MEHIPLSCQTNIGLTNPSEPGVFAKATAVQRGTRVAQAPGFCDLLLLFFFMWHLHCGQRRYDGEMLSSEKQNLPPFSSVRYPAQSVLRTKYHRKFLVSENFRMCSVPVA